MEFLFGVVTGIALMVILYHEKAKESYWHSRYKGVSDALAECEGNFDDAKKIIEMQKLQLISQKKEYDKEQIEQMRKGTC